jgi:hypothetical protein
VLPAPAGREARHLPEVGEELLELCQSVDVFAPARHPGKYPRSLQFAVVPGIRRLLKLAFVLVASAIGIWFEAVRRTPDVKRRKRLRRRARAPVH